ncbi:DUF1439 domain-containing protein [Alteromonas halophila]|nr:DUF1439 domain-containing protein [Alteromonas halophila]
MKKLLLGGLTLLLAGCAGLAQLSAYSVTQAELATLLEKQLVAQERRVRVLGIPLQLTIDEVATKIGPDDRNVVQLGSVATTTVDVFGLTYDARVRLKVEGQPFYDNDKKAIFLRSLTLLDSTVDAGGYRGNLTPLTREFKGVLNRYLETNPVYRLDTSNTAINLLTKVPLQLDVESGKLVLKPQG